MKEHFKEPPFSNETQTLTCLLFDAFILLSPSRRTSYSSVLTIVSFSMERYLAICHPLYSKTMSGFHRAVRIIALVWTISLVSALPYAFFTRINYIDRPLGSGNYLPETAFCALLKENIYPKVAQYLLCKMYIH